MAGSGSFDFGDGPDGPEEDAGEGGGRPWLPPEDRLWRHPSEVAAHGRPHGGAFGPVLDRRRRPGRRFAAGAVGAVAVAALAATVVIAMTDSHGVGTASQGVPSAHEVSVLTDPTTTVAAPLVAKMMGSLRPSLVAIRTTGPDHVAPMTGIVLPGGDLAVTAASAVGAARWVQLVTSSGQHRRVRVLGSDPHAGIAVVSTGGGLPAASFSSGELAPGDLAIAACLCGDTVAAAAEDPDAAVAEVRKVGTASTVKGGVGLVDTVVADMPLGPAPLGAVLLDAQDQVVGVLDARVGSKASGRGVFVPGSLALAVGHELATAHTVVHGWLGIRCTDTPHQGGARITAIMAGSPAASAGLREGDIVEAVDSHPVGTLAELQASLYTSPPGTAVNVVLVRAGRDLTATLTLAGSPAG